MLAGGELDLVAHHRRGKRVLHEIGDPAGEVVLLHRAENVLCGPRGLRRGGLVLLGANRVFHGLEPRRHHVVLVDKRRRAQAVKGVVHLPPERGIERALPLEPREERGLRGVKLLLAGRFAGIELLHARAEVVPSQVAEPHVAHGVEHAADRVEARGVAVLYAEKRELVEIGIVAPRERDGHKAVAGGVSARFASDLRPHDLPETCDRVVKLPGVPQPVPHDSLRNRPRDGLLRRRVVEQFHERRLALADVAHGHLEAAEPQFGGDGHPGDVGIEFDDLGVEAQRLVRVLRALAGAALHEKRVGEDLLVEVACLGLHLHLAPFGGRGAEAGNAVLFGLPAPELVGHGLVERLGRAVDAAAHGEVERAVDVATHPPVGAPVPGVHRRNNRRKGDKYQASCIHRRHSISLNMSDSCRSSPRARRAHSVSGYSRTVRFRKRYALRAKRALRAASPAQ